MQPFERSDTRESSANPQTCLILGPPRSGTTMLLRLLAGGQGVLAVSEPFLIRSALPNWRIHRQFRRLQRSAGFPFRKPPYPASLERYAGYLSELAAANGCSHLVIKETYRSCGLTPPWRNESVLERLVRDVPARVALIRDPYDTAASAIGLGSWVIGVRGWLTRMRLSNVPIFRNRLHVVRWASDNWARYVEWIRAHGLTPIRYEDLVAGPETQLPRICEQLRLPFEPCMLDGTLPRHRLGGLGDPRTFRKARSVDRRAVGRGEELSDKERRIVRETCEGMAREVGYS
ncbi:MAG: sulfotransferase [Phycisphaerae bacterium]|nr:sulfotransferase [Phycisphaerae bacterium]